MTVVRLKAIVGAAAVSTLLSSYGAAQDTDVCAPLGESYLQDADFELERLDGKSVHWRLKQHAGEPSFETDINDGVLTIRKIGTQPWLVYWQRLKGNEFAGKRMAFSAEMKWDKPETDTRGVQSQARLNLIAFAKDNKILKRFNLAYHPNPDKSGWQPLQMVVKLPPKTNFIDLGFVHEADGVLLIRNPSFYLVDASSAACKQMLTPGQNRLNNEGPSGLR